MSKKDNNQVNSTSPFKIFLVALKLGLTSFGGPIAHLGYFHEEYVKKRKWLDEKSYVELVALCQFLPGPASSQVGIGIGTIRGGLFGGILAFLGFTLPSAIALLLFALLLKGFSIDAAKWTHGLKIVAVVIVAQAVMSMGKKLCPDRARATIAIAAAVAALMWNVVFAQVIIILLAGFLGLFLYRKTAIQENTNLIIPVNKIFSIICLIIFFILLIALPFIREIAHNVNISIFDSFYRSGSLVFGGGHVVLPLLEKEVVPSGWLSEQDFLSGYGATQAVPGPLFTFSSYLGAMTNGISGAITATFAVFLPSYLLITGVLPFWNKLRQSSKIQGALLSINASVVGILLAALYNPLWVNAIKSINDFVLALILFGMLIFWKIPPWITVVMGVLGGILIKAI